VKVKSLMSADLWSVHLDDPLSKVKDIFSQHGFHHLLVVEKGELFGIISDRDLLKALSPKVDTKAATTKDLATLDKKAHQIMTPKPFCLAEDDSIVEAIKLFNEQKISCIPVLDQNGKPVGMLSWRDIMKALMKKKAG